MISAALASLAPSSTNNLDIAGKQQHSNELPLLLASGKNSASSSAAGIRDGGHNLNNKNIHVNSKQLQQNEYAYSTTRTSEKNQARAGSTKETLSKITTKPLVTSTGGFVGGGSCNSKIASSADNQDERQSIDAVKQQATSRQQRELRYQISSNNLYNNTTTNAHKSNRSQSIGGDRDYLFIGGKPVRSFLSGGRHDAYDDHDDDDEDAHLIANQIKITNPKSKSSTRQQQQPALTRASSTITTTTTTTRSTTRRDNDNNCSINLIQQLPNSLALSALNYLSNIRDQDQLTSSSSSRQVQLKGHQLSRPKLSPTISSIHSQRSSLSSIYNNQDHNNYNNHTQLINNQATDNSNPFVIKQRVLSSPVVSSLFVVSPKCSGASKQAQDRKSSLIDRYHNSSYLVDTSSEDRDKVKKFDEEEINSQIMKTTNEQDKTSHAMASGAGPAGSAPKSTPSEGKGKRFCLAMFSLLVLSIVASCQVKLISGQQLQPARSQQQQLSPVQPQTNSMTHQQPNQQVPSGVARPGVGPQPVAGSLVANVNCNKIRGHVTLTPNQQGSVTVSTQINEGPPGEVYQWGVHQFPVKPGAAMCTCSPLILGSKLIDLGEMHGNLPSNQEYSVQSSTLALFGPDSPVGHSLLLRGLKTGVVACATFLPTSRKSNYRAKFHEPLSGSVTVFQTAFGSSFLSHLMYSNGTRRHSVHRFDLVKSDDDMLLLNSGHRPLTASPSQSSSNTMLIEQREHDNEISQCRRFTSGEPLLRNMTYQLSVSTENFGMRSRTALVLPQIPFETFSSVYVIVYSEHNPLEPIACAPLKFVRPKTAAAKFQTTSVQGNIIFSQDSPYDPTQARINLQLPNSDGHSYGIDELPMIIRRKSDTRVCPNIREIIYNPHHIEPSSVPGEGEATSDQYAVGDLSGKYGSLAGKSSERIQVSDFNLPLFGPNSIVGRAMTIYSAEGVAIACSNVELNTPMTTAFATFDYGIQGQFIFRQAQNDCNGDTYVYIEVSRPMGPPSSSAASGSSQQQPAAGAANHDHHHQRTLDHNWHVHVNPIDSGLDHLSTTECAAAGPHFNPYNTSTANIYSRDCTPFNVLRCELGDLASKMFTLEIPPYRVKGGQEPDIGKFFGTDIDLPLCGPVSIVNRSVVVHGPDFGAHRLACSSVIEFKPRSSSS